MLSKKCIKRNEDLVNNKDETGIGYITYEFNNIRSVYEGSCGTCNVEIQEETINNSTFIKTPEWLALKRSVLSPLNNENKCFQYYVILSLYNEQFGKNYCRILKIRPYINNLNLENINFPPQEQDYNTLEINNKSIALNILQVNNEQKMSHLYKSEHNRTRENKAILLILEDKHFVAVKNLNSLFKDKSKCPEHFCINCFKKFRTKSRLENFINFIVHKTFNLSFLYFIFTLF